jgi:hypothetical protein
VTRTCHTGQEGRQEGFNGLGIGLRTGSPAEGHRFLRCCGIVRYLNPKQSKSRESNQLNRPSVGLILPVKQQP